MRRGDVFETINGRKPRCRVEAWQRLLPAGPVSAEIVRHGATKTLTWDNRRDGEAGVTVEYDFDPARVERLQEIIAGCRGRSLLLTSELGHQVVTRVLELLQVDADAAEAVPVKNHTFGGTIGAAGLLTIDDYLAAHNAWVDLNPCAAAPSQIIVPGESFDRLGFDLVRSHFSRLREVTGLPIVPC
jgi:hypothetical protein